MALQEPALCIPHGGVSSGNNIKNDKVYINAISASKKGASSCHFTSPIFCQKLIEEADLRDRIIKGLLGCISYIPKYYFNGGDCLMSWKLSRMLRDIVLELPLGSHTTHLCLYVYVGDSRCSYTLTTIENPPCFYEQPCPPPIESVRDLACVSGMYSVPDRAMRIIKRLKVQDDHRDEDHCVICLQRFSPSYDDDDLAELACSHVFHYECIMTWFVLNVVSCPLCRSPFNQAS